MLLCVAFVVVCCEVGGVLEHRNGQQEEEDPHLDKSAQENCSDCGARRHFKRALEGAQRN